MMSKAAPGERPDPRPEAPGRDSAVTDSQRADRPTRDRVLDLDVVGPCASVWAADPDIAGAVDGEAGVAAETLGDSVRSEALARAAGVEPHAGRAGQLTASNVD